MGHGGGGTRTHLSTIKAVSQLLRNTPAVCRDCYVRPPINSAFEAEKLAGAMAIPGGLTGDEAALLTFLRKNAKPLLRRRS